jgi:phage tail sheath gpL-like
MSGNTLNGAATAWDDVTGKPATFTPATHTHDQFTTLVMTTPPVSSNEVKATATITVAGIPTAGQTITINGVVYTFSDTATNPFEILIASPAFTTSIATAISSTINSKDKNVVSTKSGSVVTLYALSLREEGNAITLTTTAGNLTLSGATLSGGGSGTVTATSGVNMQMAVLYSRHIYLSVDGSFGLRSWILIS